MKATATYSERSASQREVRNSVRSHPGQATTTTAPRTGPGETKRRLDRRTLTPSSRATTPARRGQRAPKPVSAPQESPLVTQQTRGQTWRVAKRPRTEVHRPPARSPVERGLTILAFAIAILLVLLFGFDLATGWPFHRHSLLMDVGYLACGTLLTYLSWNTYQGLR
jgi:hypothetical protein